MYCQNSRTRNCRIRNNRTKITMNKVIMRLNRSKMEGMLLMMTYLLEQWPAEDKAEKLLHVIVDKIRTKMRNRLDQVNTKNGYTITLSQEEALAFDLWFGQMALPESLYTYEQNIAQGICVEIDRICA